MSTKTNSIKVFRLCLLIVLGSSIIGILWWQSYRKQTLLLEVPLPRNASNIHYRYRKDIGELKWLGYSEGILCAKLSCEDFSSYIQRIEKNYPQTRHPSLPVSAPFFQDYADSQFLDCWNYDEKTAALIYTVDTDGHRTNIAYQRHTLYIIREAVYR